MARKGNPISVRLDLNRSSDSSWFSEGALGIALFFSLLKRMIISITVLLLTRILLNCNWGFSLEAAFFAPFFTDLLDLLVSVMDRIPLSVGGDGSGPNLSKQPSFDALSPSPETKNDGNPIDKKEAKALPPNPIRLPLPPQHTLDRKETSCHREEI